MKKCPFCAEEIQDEAIVCKHCGRDLSSPSKASTSTRSTTKRSTWLVVGLLVAVVVFGLLYMGGGSSDTGSAPPGAMVPQIDSVAIYDDGVGSEVVPYGGYIGKEFTAPPGRQCAVHGSVIATEGGNEDLIVYVLDDNQFINWKTDPATATTFTSAQQKATTLDVPLNAGHYQLIISNRFSAMTNKMASASVYLVCRT